MSLLLAAALALAQPTPGTEQSAGDYFDSMSTQQVLDTIDICQRAQIAAFAGDNEWLNRFVAELPVSRGLVVATFCLSYAKGVSYGVAISKTVEHPKFTPAAQ